MTATPIQPIHLRDAMSILDELQRKAEAAPACTRCGGAMKPGKAMGQTAVARRSSRGPNDVRTFYAGGSGRLIDCMKCERCGWSVTGAQAAASSSLSALESAGGKR